MEITIRINIYPAADESLWLSDTNSSVEPKDFNALLNELNGFDAIEPNKELNDKNNN